MQNENDLDWTLLPQNLRKVSTLLFRNLTLFSQGYPTTVFCKISVRRRRLKISRGTFHSCTIFDLLASLRMHFQKSKSTLDSVKRVINVFWRKPSLGAPVQPQRNITQHLKHSRTCRSRSVSLLLAVVREVQQFYACATFKNLTFHSTLFSPYLISSPIQ